MVGSFWRAACSGFVAFRVHVKGNRSLAGLAAVLLALSAGVAAGVLIDARMAGVARAATGDYTAFDWGSDGYFSGLKRGIKPVIENETNTSGDAAQDMGWDNTPVIKFGKEGTFKDPSDSSVNVDISGGYRALGVGPISSVDVILRPSHPYGYLHSSYTTELQGGEILLFADSPVSNPMYWSSLSNPNDLYTAGNIFEEITNSFKSRPAAASVKISTTNYSLIEQSSFVARMLEGVCNTKNGTTDGSSLLGCTGPPNTHKTPSAYAVFPLSSGDTGLFLNVRYSIGTRNGGCRSEYAPCDYIIWTRSPIWDDMLGYSRYGGNSSVLRFSGETIYESPAFNASDPGVLRPAVRLSIADLVVTSAADGSQPVDVSSELFLTFADRSESLSGSGESLSDDGVLTIQGSHSLDTNKQLGWKIIEKGEEPQAVVASGRVTASGTDSSATVDISTLGLESGKKYDLWYWGHKSGSADEGWSNTATVPQYLEITAENWEAPKPGVDLDKSAPNVFCASGLWSPERMYCSVFWDIAVVNTGGVTLDDFSVTDRVSSLVGDVQVRESPGFVQVSGKWAHSVGLDAYGRVWAWGQNRYGESGDGLLASDDAGVPPRIMGVDYATNMTGVHFIQVSSGHSRSLALDEQGRVWTWGRNNKWQAGDGSNTDTAATRAPRLMESYASNMVGVRFVQIDAGGDHSVAIDSDGRVWTWGTNGFASGDGSSTNNAVTTVPRIMSDYATNMSGVAFVQVDAEGDGIRDHTVGLDDQGRVWTWGLNNSGQAGDGTKTGSKPRIMGVDYATDMGAVAFKQVAAGNKHSIALDSEGKLWAWGANDEWQSGDGTTIDDSTTWVPRQIASYASNMVGVEFTSISAGGANSHAIDSAGRVWTWGGNINGQSGDGTSTSDSTTVVPRIMGTDYVESLVGDTAFTSLAVGNNIVTALDDEGNIWAWGDDQYQVSGDGVPHSNDYRPGQISGLKGRNMEGFSKIVSPDNSYASNDFDVREFSYGRLLAAGRTTLRVLGRVERSSQDSVVVNQAWASSTAVQRDAPSLPAVPTSVEVTENAWDAEPNDGVPHNASCTTDADVTGESGDACDQVPAVIDRIDEANLDLDKSAPEVDCSNEVVCSVGWEVTVNNSGDVSAANAEILDRASSEFENVSVRQMPGFVQVSEEAAHTVALDSNGHIWTWGANNYGQSGDGSTVNNAVTRIPRRMGRDYAVEAVRDVRFTQISAGNQHSIALDSLGRIWAWGRNNGGESGDGTNTVSAVTYSPRLMQSYATNMVGVKFVQVDAGGSHSLAVDSEGRVWTWGNNAGGQSGDGTTTVSAATRKPRMVESYATGMSQVRFVQVVAGQEYTNGYSIALDEQGRIWTWGSNSEGKLGDGTTTVSADTRVPRMMRSYSARMNGVVFHKVSAGTKHSVALDSEGNLWTWGVNAAGQSGDGTVISDKQTRLPRELTVDIPVPSMQGVRFVQVNAGGTSSSAVDTQGRIWAWGANGDGQSGDGTSIDTELTRIPRLMGVDYAQSEVSGSVFLSVTAGIYGSTALDSDGNIWTWGTNEHGLAGDGDVSTVGSILLPQRISGVDGLNANGFFVEWQMEEPLSAEGFDAREFETALLLPRSRMLLQVSGSVTRGGTDKVVVNQAWATADGLTRLPPDIPDVPMAVDVIANGWDSEPDDGVPGNGSCTTDADGSGEGDACDQVPAVVLRREEPVVPKLPGLDVDKGAPEVTCPGSGDVGHGSCVVSWDVLVSNTGDTALSGVSLSDRMSSSVSGVGVSETPSFTAVSAGGSGGVGLDARGRVWAWGDPVFSGDLDASGVGPWLVAEQAPVMQGAVFTRVAAGDAHVVALDAQGRVWSWGANGSYQSGDGSKTENDAQLEPRVMGVDYAAAMSGEFFVSGDAGATHSVALDEDGRVWVWGNNAQRQSGDNSTGVTAEKVSPRVVGVDITGVASGSDSVAGVVFTSVSAGGDQTVALDEDGRVWRWGSVTDDEDGESTGQNRKPSLMASYMSAMQDVVFTAVSAGGMHAVALDEDGRVWSWGNNEKGQSGDGTQDEDGENIIVRIMGEDGYATSMKDVGFKAVSAGGSHSLALDEDGRVWSWGSNAQGQSGDGTMTDDAGTWVPRVMGEAGYGVSMSSETFISVSAGGVHAHALDATGRLWSWGDDQGVDGTGGVLADGQTLLTPRAVSGVGGSNRDAFARSVPPDGLPVSEGLWATRTYALGAIPVPGSTILLRVTATATRTEGVDQVVVNQAWATADEKTRPAPTAPTVPLAAQVTAQGWDKEPGDGVPGNASCVTDADGGLGGADACDQVPGIVIMLDAPLDPDAPVTGLPYTGAFPWWLLILMVGITVGGAGIAGMHRQTRLGMRSPGAGHSSFPGMPRAWMRRTLRALPCRHARVR